MLLDAEGAEIVWDDCGNKDYLSGLGLTIDGTKIETNNGNNGIIGLLAPAEYLTFLDDEAHPLFTSVVWGRYELNWDDYLVDFEMTVTTTSACMVKTYHFAVDDNVLVDEENACVFTTGSLVSDDGTVFYFSTTQATIENPDGTVQRFPCGFDEAGRDLVCR